MYCRIPIISLGLSLFERIFYWAYSRGRLFSDGLVIGRNFAFQNKLSLTIKTTKNTQITASINSSWAYIREDVLSEGYLRLRFGGLTLFYLFIYFYLFIIFFFFWGGGLLSEFYDIYKPSQKSKV